MPTSIFDPPAAGVDATDSRSAIASRASAEGFDAIGFTRPEAIGNAGADLREYLALGHHGDMGWMEANFERRGDPHTLWPDARSVVVVAQNYGPDTDPIAGLAQTDRGVISVYAKGRDYHDVVKGRLKRLASWTASQLSCEVKVFVDTAPVMEKPLAAAAGLGFQGKHTNLVSRDFGSWLFLGVMLTTLELKPDDPEPNHCGSCRACLDICPTRAFPAPHRIDATRCISYLTIEHKGHIAPEFRAAIGNRVYGCDDCLAVCPWNKFATRAADARLHARDQLHDPPLAELARLDDAAFRTLFAGTAVKRTGRDRFLRNVMIAIGNSDDPALIPIVSERLGDSSALVRAMAVWALGRLADAAEVAAEAASHLPQEPDDSVRAEWHAVLARAEASRP